MRIKLLTVAVCGALAAPLAHADVDVLGKALQIYGKLHASLDYYDRGATTATVTEPTGKEITSNSTRLGFKGEKELVSGLKGIWKFESEFDAAGESGTLAARNRFVGLSGGWGSVVLGIHDTPFKDIGGNYSLFGDTVGDYRSILGQVSSNDNQFNQRAKSMAMYQFKQAGFSASLMYSPDFEDHNDPDTGATGINNSLLGAGVGFKVGGLDLGAAYEKQKNIDGTNGKDASGLRLGVKYKLGALQLGGVFESLKDDGYGVRMARNAYGVNAAYKVASFTFAGQYFKASESDLAAGSDGADQYSLGVYYSFAKEAQVYAMYGDLKNDTNASYQLARSGHGQAYAPTKAGESVSAFSVGMIYSF